MDKDQNPMALPTGSPGEFPGGRGSIFSLGPGLARRTSLARPLELGQSGGAFRLSRLVLASQLFKPAACTRVRIRSRRVSPRVVFAVCRHLAHRMADHLIAARSVRELAGFKPNQRA